MHPIPSDIIAAARAPVAKTRVPASVSLGQWIIESGWGVHSPGNNPFGMKPRKGMNDPSQQLITTEFLGGKYVKVSQPFRKFISISEAFEAHAELLSTAPVYAMAMREIPLNSCPTVEAIGRFIDKMASHYATDPLYASKLKSIIASNRLGDYDV